MAAIYSRKSKFTGKGESIQNQIELCKEYADKHFSIEKFIIFEDEGYSGGNTNRPMYRKMLDNAASGNFDILICYRLDRISRSITDFTYLIEMLSEKSIDFISIRENFDTSTPMGRAMMYIASVFAQLERETISERIRDNMYSLAKTGRWLGGKTPTGFKSEQMEYYDDSNNKKMVYKLSPKPQELNLVRLLYDKYLELHSLTGLETWTLKNNIKTRNKKFFDKSILKFILSNPVYTFADEAMYKYFSLLGSYIANSEEEFSGKYGLMVYNKHDERKNRTTRKDEAKWIVAVGLHQGIIPSHCWINVQNLLKEGRKRAPRTGTGKTGLITNFLRCQNCGAKMRITTYRRNNKVYYYYKCLRKEKSKGSKCNINNINGKIADELVMGEIKKIAFDKNDLYRYLSKISKTFKTTYSNKLRLEKEILHYENSINNLTLRLTKHENISASKYIIRQIEEYDKKISKLRITMESLKGNRAYGTDYQIDINTILSLANNFTSNIDKLDFDEKKMLLNILVDEIIWDGDKLTIKILDS